MLIVQPVATKQEVEVRLSIRTWHTWVLRKHWNQFLGQFTLEDYYAQARCSHVLIDRER